VSGGTGGVSGGTGGVSGGTGGVSGGTGGVSGGTGGGNAGAEVGSTCGSGGPQGKEIVKVSVDKSFYAKKDRKPGTYFYMIGAPPTDEPLPLLIAFHGDEGTTRGVQSLWETFWKREQSFILVIPQSPGTATTWTYQFTIKGKYIRKIIEDVGSKHNVDVSRIYATGYSGGTEFLGTVSKRMQDIFAAINFSCGGGGWFQINDAPPRPECVFDARIWIADKGDFLGQPNPRRTPSLPSSENLKNWLEAGNISVDYERHSVCEGHCCSPPDVIGDQVEPTWNWLMQHTKCDMDYTASCVGINALP